MTRDPETSNSTQRQYPPVYERIIPIALAVLVGAITLMLCVIAYVVITNTIPGG